MGGKIEGHAQTLLTGLDVGLVERIALLDCREPSVLEARIMAVIRKVQVLLFSI